MDDFINISAVVYFNFIYYRVYNKLVRLNIVQDQWSQIDVLLKKRADLIPNLVETVKDMQLMKVKLRSCYKCS